MIWCIKTYKIAYVKTQKIRFTIHYVKPTTQLLFKIRFPKGGPTCIDYRLSSWIDDMILTNITTAAYSKYKNDIRKAWDTLKEIINKKTFKSDFPSCFVQEGVEITGSKIIADKFNEYFTEIGPKLARSIDAANKVPFNSYLTTPCASSFNFAYRNPNDIRKIIRNLRPKSSAGHDNISTKLLKEIEHAVWHPLSIIINQCLCTSIFPDKLKIAKVIPLFKKDDN